MKEKDNFIKVLAGDIAEIYREKLYLQPGEVEAFRSTAEQIVNRIVSKYTLPGVKVDSQTLDKILQEVEVEIRKEGYKIIGAKIHPSIKEMIKEKSK